MIDVVNADGYHVDEQNGNEDQGHSESSVVKNLGHDIGGTILVIVVIIVIVVGAVVSLVKCYGVGIKCCTNSNAHSH